MDDLGLPDKAYYRASEVARVLDVSDATVRNWIQEGRLKAHRFGKVLRIPREELLRYLQDAQGSSRPGPDS
jgi:excisionase family DNA binding protein